MTLYDLLNEGNAALQQAGDTDGENDAKLLLFEAFHLDLVHFLMDRLRPLSEQDAKVQEQIRTYREMIEKRASRIPLQQILGSQEFMGLEFYVNEHVLIPRQDTETLVELVLQEQQGREKKLLDLCTGSGCIAISLAVKGGYESVTATDLSEEALKVAERNAKTHQKKIIFRQGDLFSALPRTEAGTFDIITSNPPYIPTAVIATLEPEVRELELWLDKVFGEKVEQVLMAVVMVFSVVMAIGIFMVLPLLIANACKQVIHSDTIMAILEGVIRIAIFIAYIKLISRLGVFIILEEAGRKA